MEYQLASFQNTVCNLVEKWNADIVMYCVKWKMTKYCFLLIDSKLLFFIFDL